MIQPSHEASTTASRTDVLLDAVRRSLEMLDLHNVFACGGTTDVDLTSIGREHGAPSESAVETRRREFAAGRLYAREALNALGLQGATIRRGDHGEPIWPRGITGSISHSAGLCLVVATPDTAVRSIGIDIEVATSLEPGLWPALCSAHELATLRHAANPAIAGRRVLELFSAKEAGYKCQFPMTGEFIDFPAATVHFEANRGRFLIELERPFHDLVGPSPIRGVLATVDDFVVSVALIARGGQGR